MNLLNLIAFVVFPYLALTVFCVGHLYRYVTDRLTWNARSSQFLEKDQHYPALTMFHWGILLTLAGHSGGLLVPQAVFDAVGIDAAGHLRIAYLSGMAVGVAAVVGGLWLIGRRLMSERLRATTSANDWFTLGAIIIVASAGLFNVLFGHYNVLYTIAPWIRGIVTFRPQPELMVSVPMSYKVHILLALALLGFSPFSRLVHIWSAPIFYVLRVPILFRKHPMDNASVAVEPDQSRVAG